MIVWCMLTVTIYAGNIPWITETAVKGKIVKTQQDLYLVDFSEYALEKEYVGNWSDPRLVKKDVCIKE